MDQVGDGEVVDERRVLSEQGVGNDAEGVFEENDGSQLGASTRSGTVGGGGV